MKSKPKCSIVTFAVFLLCATVASSQDSAAVFQACTRCHGTPDPKIAGDDAWIGRVATTACITPADSRSSAKRTALIAWLKGKDPVRPRVVNTARAARTSEGRLRTNIVRGSVLLGPKGNVGDASVRVRLVWSGEKPAEPRAVPAGEWEVKGYRVVRADDRGVEWQIWGSGAKGRRFVVEAGATSTLDLDLDVHVKARVRKARGKLRIGLGVTGDSDMGLTVVKAGDRVPAAYLLGHGDDRIAGHLKYG